MSASDFWSTLSDFLDANSIIVRIIITIVAAIIVRAALIWLVNRSVRRVISGAKKLHAREQNQVNEGKKPRRELVPSPFAAERLVQRTQTLGAFSRNVITVFVTVIAAFIILDDLGVNLTALLASAGIIAAGLAFGAQRIVNDILNGIFMVFEDQLGMGDSVIIGDVDGTVELVGIRITQVRSYDGTLWFIRNGEIAKIGNLSHGWGRAICDISVLPNTDLTRVRSLIDDTVSHVVKQPQIAAQVIAPPEIIGLQQLSEDRATIRVAVKTRPDAQADVLSEIRSHIKIAFDAAGIRFAPDVTAVFLRPPVSETSSTAKKRNTREKTLDDTE